MERFIRNNIFRCCSSVLIIANAVYIGSVTDLDVRAAIHDSEQGTSRRAELKEMLFSTDVFFTVAVCLELLLRIVALRWKFFISRDWFWNLFDVLPVLSSIVELVGYSTEVKISFLKLFRLLRILRAIQVVRRITLFRKMHLMFLAILKSVLALLGAVFMLLFIMYIFAVLFLQGVAQHLAHTSSTDSHCVVLATFFRSLPMTLLTLWMCLSGGIDWWELEEVLLDTAPGYAVLLICFQVFMILVVLNIVTGTFVNDSIEVAQNDQDHKAFSKRERKVKVIRCATRIFEEMDTDHTMSVTRRQFERAFQRPGVKYFFQTIDMDVTDAIKVFEALDVNGNRVLGIDEFVVGCAAIHGPARTECCRCR